jgi:hypothetical protein
MLAIMANDSVLARTLIERTHRWEQPSMWERHTYQYRDMSRSKTPEKVEMDARTTTLSHLNALKY